MNQELLLNISKDTFYFYYKSLSDDDLIYILNNSSKVDSYIDMDIINILKIYDRLNDDIKIKLINNICLKNLLCLYKNNKISEINLWENKYALDDINNTIILLNNNNLLFLINDLHDVKFKLNISKLYFYQIRCIYPFIKDDNIKFKLLINGIDEQYLINLINYFDNDSINFLNLNYNFIFRFNQISLFVHTSLDDIDNMEISKLQIILLLNTSNEYKIKKHILEQDTVFIKNIINILSNNTFLYIIKNIQISIFYDIFDCLSTDKINVLLPYLNNKILSKLFLKLDVNKLCRIINNLSLNQFIECLYYISDSKLDCLKNMNSEQKLYINNLFAAISSNLYMDYLPYFSKQIIFCILNTTYRNVIIQNIEVININIVKLVIKNLNYDEIIAVLNKYDTNDKMILINSISDEQYSMISNYVDKILYENENISDNNIIIFKLFFVFINLNLSKKSYNKIKQILNTDNV
jgi:hypothetical protein